MVRRPSILIVEEDEALRDALTRAVRAAGAAAETVRGPAEALAFLGASWPSPGAVLVDLESCGDRGPQLVRDIRSHPRHGGVPVLTVGRGAEGSPGLGRHDLSELVRLLLSLCRTEREGLRGLRLSAQPA